MIVNNEQMNNAPLEAPLDARKSVIEAPEVDLSAAETVPVIPENTQSKPPTEPEKKFSNKKAYKWLYDLNYAQGEVMTEHEIDGYANERISYNLPAIYRKLGMETPDNDGLVSLYESFYEPIKVEAEKKKFKRNYFYNFLTKRSDTGFRGFGIRIKHRIIWFGYWISKS